MGEFPHKEPMVKLLKQGPLIEFLTRGPVVEFLTQGVNARVPSTGDQ